MTEKELRQKVVDTAVSYLGCKEANGSHRKIIDLYNSHKPLARGYAVKYTDAWCSTFASAVAIACGLTDIIPTECGCERHIDLFKKLGSWVENDAYVPSPGDYIFYDWQDGSNYATTNNTGSADHVGIVVSCDGKTIKVIEGNMSDAVGYDGMEKACRRKGKRTTVYYCHPHAPHERGSNENMNRIIRRFFPKGTNFDEVPISEIRRAEEWMNNYPREVLGWQTAATLLRSYMSAC